ncbi:EboA domain-containing protein (plasmid) [Streptomyces sp. NBC_00028]|uniref:EboA domain-containing protein n=1 Tax=Streptomyces sp. NBC_00028 TaxID=2975624 RepID=UPI00324400C4
MTGRHLADVMTDVVKDRVADPQWLGDARWQVAQNPDAITMLFPAVGRRCGRGLLADAGPELADWSVDDAARVLLLSVLPLRGAALARQVAALYWQGGAAEKRAVLRALSGPGVGVGAVELPHHTGVGSGARELPQGLDIGAAAVELLHDAIRTNDPRLVAAAVGPAARRLDDGMWRQAVLKCVFMEIPLTAVADLDRRADGELARMLADLDDERRAAGRSLPDDATVLLALISDPEWARSAAPEDNPARPAHQGGIGDTASARSAEFKEKTV